MKKKIDYDEHNPCWSIEAQCQKGQLTDGPCSVGGEIENLQSPVHGESFPKIGGARAPNLRMRNRKVLLQNKRERINDFVW